MLRMIDLCFHGFAFKDEYGYEQEQSTKSVEVVKFRSASSPEAYSWEISTYRSGFWEEGVKGRVWHTATRQARLALPSNTLNSLMLETALRNMLAGGTVRFADVTDDLRTR